MKRVLGWMLFIVVMPIIWLLFGLMRLWELITGKRVDFDGPK
jgi:hypothetical protein